MKKCVFTICAKNYIGLARILEVSLKKHNPNIDFYIFVADRFEEKTDLPDNVLISFDCFGSELPWEDMAFKYDLTEFCTSIKPSCFKYVLENLGYEKAIYFDPDIYIFDSLDGVYDLLDKYSIVITPHLALIQEAYTGDTPERNLLASGVYNLGFCALKKSKYSIQFIYWWRNRLLDQCFANFPENYYTDQKWIDMLPCFFPSDVLHISRHLGLNVAPWNFFEREIINQDSEFWVKGRNVKGEKDREKLIFIHYSGYNYSKLIKGEIFQKNIPNLAEYSDINIILEVYSNAIQSMLSVFNQFIHLKYTYNSFDNEVSITSFQRRLYHGIEARQEIYKDVFSSKETDTYYSDLKKHRLFPKIGEIEKYGKETPSVKKKVGRVNKFFTILYKIVGYDRFYLMVRLFKPYSKFETYSFLLKRNNNG